MAPQLPRAITGCLDDQTAAVVIEIQLQDVNQLLESERRKGTGRPSDFMQTLLLQKEELQTALTSINDRQMSRSMASAILADSQAIAIFVAQERLAETDRAYACQLGGVAIPPPSHRPTPPQTPRNRPPTHQTRPLATRPQPRQPNFRPEPTPPQTPRAPASGFGRQETPTPSTPRPAAPRASTSVPPPPLPQPPAPRTPSTNTQGQKSNTPSVVEEAQRQIPRAAPNVKPFVPSPHSDTKTVNSSAAGLDVKQSECINSTENRISQVSSSSFQHVLKEVGSKIGKLLKDVSPKPTTILGDTAQHNNASASVQTSIVLGKRAQEDALGDTNTAKKQCTGQAKSLYDPLRGVGTQAYEHNARPAMGPLKRALSKQDPSANDTDTGKGKGTTESFSVDNAGAPTSIQPVAQAHANAPKPVALQMTPSTKRPLEDSSDILPPAKHVDTGKTKDGVLVETGRTPHSTPHVSLNGVSKGNTTQLKDSTAAKSTTLTFGQLSCVSCGGIFYAYNAARMSCQHVYCRDCVNTVVKTALIDEAMFPPRCCKQLFPINDMQRLLTPELNSQYGEKKIEFETSDRTYCSNPNCSTFLYPVNIVEKEKIGICPVCFIVTCTMCKGGEHIGDCPEDSGILQVLDLAKKEGWKRCSKCNRVIELKYGCNHITYKYPSFL